MIVSISINFILQYLSQHLYFKIFVSTCTHLIVSVSTETKLCLVVQHFVFERDGE